MAERILLLNSCLLGGDMSAQVTVRASDIFQHSSAYYLRWLMVPRARQGTLVKTALISEAGYGCRQNQITNRIICVDV